MKAADWISIQQLGRGPARSCDDCARLIGIRDVTAEWRTSACRIDGRMQIALGQGCAAWVPLAVSEDVSREG